jgi:hypothetical protein
LNLPFANLPITVLNPVETSVAAAIIDTQVDADAYLVPSTTELLESYLGVRTTPGSQVGSMFSQLLAAGTAPGVTNVNGTAIANAGAPGSSVVSLGHNPVSNRGQSAIPGINSSLQGSSSADEPIEPVAAGAPAPAQQAPAEGQPQVPVQQAPPGGQAPAPAPAPEPNPADGQAPQPGNAPQPAAPDGEGAAPGPEAQAALPGQQEPAHKIELACLLPSISDSAIDAARDLTDARILAQVSDRYNLQPNEPVYPSDTYQTLSVSFATAVVTSAGYHLALGAVDRSRSQGRSVPRWSGAERPTRRKSALASR